MQKHADFEKHAVKHPGVVIEKARSEGMTVHEWAEKHQHDKDVWGERARLALTFERQAAAKKR